METTKLEATIKELSATAEFIAQDNARLKHAADEQKVMKVVGKFMVRKMREKLTEAKASEQVMRDNQAGINHKLVRSEQKASAIERELMVLRRRAAEREAAFEQQATDAKDLSTENRMLLERSEQLATLKSDLTKLEAQEKRMKEEQKEELRKVKAETEALEEQMAKAKSATGANVAASEAELAALQKEYDEWSTSAAATRERIYNQLVSSIDMLTLHKEDVENQLAGLKKYCDDKCEALAPLLDEGAVELA